MEANVASGNKVLAKRRELGLSQEALAQAGGVTRQAIGAIESGRTQPGVVLALAIARTLNATVEELFGGEIDEDISLPAGEATPRAGQRVVVATIGERRVLRGLDQPSLGSVPESAGAIVVDTRGRSARVRSLRARPHNDDTVFVSGCDVGLGLLVRHLDASKARGFWFSASNRDSLADLAAGRTHVAAIHGPEAERKKIGSARRFDLAKIEEGWLVPRGNPLRLRGARDLARGEIRLANRPAGSGARSLLDAELRRAGIDPLHVPGYERELGGHLDVARAVSQGFADAGVGIASVARLFDLDFIPLRSERSSLVIPEAYLRHAGVAALVETLRSNAYRRDLEAFGPYDTRRIGEELV
jgi:molybdate-binding protein/DNA-binding XRE family transcriptional regulator